MPSAFAPEVHDAPELTMLAIVGASGKLTMNGITVDIATSMATFEGDWRRLERDNLNSLHHGYDWCAAWVKTHRAPLAIVRCRSADRTLFILPLEIVRHNMVRTAQFIAGRFSNINTGLFSAEFRADASEELVAAVWDKVADLLGDKVDLVSLQNVPLLWRDQKHPFAYLPAVENQNHAFQLPLLASFEATLQQLNAKKRRKKFRHQVRKLDATGGYEHVVAHDSRDQHALLDTFFEQKSSRFKALGLPNVFQPPETQAFFHMLLEAGNGSQDVPLQLHALRYRGEHAGHIAAISGVSRKGDHVICQFGSIDETVLPEASPGELLFWLMIEKSCSEGAALFDFGIGDQSYKRCWCTTETTQFDILLPVSALGRLAAIAQRGVTRTKAVIKSNPQLYGLVQRLRARAGAAVGKD